MEARPYTSRVRAIREAVDALTVQVKPAVETDYGRGIIWVAGRRVLERENEQFKWVAEELTKWSWTEVAL